jgi:Fe-S-cluster containining protein
MLGRVLKPEDCKKCKECCKFFLDEDWDIPILTKSEKNLQQYDSNIVYFRSGLWKINILGLNNEERIACPFLVEDTGCILKNNKPFECRIWPFNIMRQKKNKLFIALSKECPVINKCDKKELIAIVMKNKDELINAALENPEIIKNFNDNYEVILEFE